MELQQRKIYVLKLPLQTDISILRPEQLIIKFPNGRTVDIGCLCYLTRQLATKNSHDISKKGKLVQLNSLNTQRVKGIRRLIAYISYKLSRSSNRTATIVDLVTRFVAFVNWVDKNGSVDLFNNQQIARDTVAQYTNHLKDEVSRNKISYWTAKQHQTAVIKVFSEFFENENFKIGIQVLKAHLTSKNATQPPCEADVAKVLSLCESLFDGLTSLVLDKKHYPYILEVPTYLNFPQNMLWVFPALSWFIHPAKALDKRASCLGFNYKTGQLNSLEELKALRLKPSSTKKNQEILHQSEKNLIEANQDFHHQSRRNAATIAFNAFILLFLSQTGMNWAQFIDLQWNDEFKISIENQQFRTIKWRAGGKPCHFELSIEFMPRFKRFLKLRKYILEPKQFEYLFFAIGRKGLGSPKQLNSNFLPNLAETLSRINPDFEMINSRQWRATKSDWLIRHTDLSTTAKILQNTEKTVLQSYIAGSKSLHLQEMSSFLNELSSAIVIEKNNQGDSLQGAAGKCISYNTPSPINNSHELNKPNCFEPQSCIFCDKFRVHIDTIDVRKLLSCRYYIEKITALIGSLEQQQESILPTLYRIDSILDEIRSHNSELVENISKEVEEGELDNYWARKLEMFMELNWIS